MRVDHLPIDFQKLYEKHERKLVLLAKLRKSCEGDPQGYLDSAGTYCCALRSSNGGESYFQMIKRIAAGRKCLMAVSFLTSIRKRAKSWSFKLGVESGANSLHCGLKQNCWVRKHIRSMCNRAHNKDFRMSWIDFLLKSCDSTWSKSSCRMCLLKHLNLLKTKSLITYH